MDSIVSILIVLIKQYNDDTLPNFQVDAFTDNLIFGKPNVSLHFG